MTEEFEPEDNERISAVGFLFKLWDERLFIIAMTLLFLCAAEIYLLNQPTKYTTTMLIGHVTSVDSAPATSGSGLGGAIALIGLGTGLSNDTKYNLFLTFIKTENFARQLQRKYHFERKHSDTTLPTVAAVRGYLGGIAGLNIGDTTVLQTQTGDREFAKQMMVIVYNEGNQAVRTIDTQRAKKFAAFIEDRFRSETSRPMQDALGSLLVNQERFLMVTSVDLPYAVQLLDGPTSTDEPTAPKGRLIQMIGVAVGFSMSIFVILVWEAIAAERRVHGLETRGPSAWIRHIPALAKRLLRNSGRRNKSPADQRGR